ncbi:YggS family pyridoxal phosphate-dependent enzyme [Nocardioides panacisoli]|uniref:Pyridoxal phosphate homeostasis protein n=1 Tax=Nocardioides panacisoli TaxID=627624 RepID=A0ABP7I8Q6_9ACTN
MSRADDVARGLGEVRDRIASACAEAGRGADDVTLVVITKYFPASDVRILADLGVTDVGENRHQEAAAKAEECADLPLTWHFVGGLQSNKAAAVAGYAGVVHSVDRVKLVRPLDRGAGERPDARAVDVLLQVSLDPPGTEHRAGAAPADLAALADTVAAAEHLRLRGLMAVAPLGEDPAGAFERLAGLRADFLSDHPDATWLSAGMSGDLEQAIAVGATHVRVGTAVLGSRPRVQ